MALYKHCLVERRKTAFQEIPDRGIYRERIWSGKAGKYFTLDITI